MSPTAQSDANGIAASMAINRQTTAQRSFSPDNPGKWPQKAC